MSLLPNNKRVLSGLAPRTRYVVRVRAISPFGVNSDWSEALDFTTPETEFLGDNIIGLDPAPEEAGSGSGGIALLTNMGDLLSHDGTEAVRVPLGDHQSVLTVDLTAPAGVVWGPRSPLGAKGDIYTHNGLEEVAQPVGENGQVLRADTTSESGLAWDDIVMFGPDPDEE